MDGIIIIAGICIGSIALFGLAEAVYRISFRFLFTRDDA